MAILVIIIIIIIIIAICPAAVTATSVHPLPLPQPPGASTAAARMNAWGLAVETSGASRTGFDTYPHGAAQPAEEDEAQRARIQVVSFNFGMPQSMLTAEQRWYITRAINFRDCLVSLGNGVENDFVANNAEKHRLRVVVASKNEKLLWPPLPPGLCLAASSTSCSELRGRALLSPRPCHSRFA